MEVKVLDKTGKETGRKVQLSDSVFAIEPNNHAVYLDVKQYLANQRQGTHKAKERAEVTGSTRKIKKQKGTGTARAIIVLNNIDFAEVKTKAFMTIMSDMNLAYEKVLFVLPTDNKNVYLSARNIQGANVVTADSLNTYEILNANKVVIVEGAVEKIESILN
jgi:large subunit ribosomal protein L4